MHKKNFFRLILSLAGLIAVATIIAARAGIYGLESGSTQLTAISLVVLLVLGGLYGIVKAHFYRRQVPYWWPHGYSKPMVAVRERPGNVLDFFRALVAPLTTLKGAIMLSLAIAIGTAINFGLEGKWGVAITFVAVLALLFATLRWRHRRAAQTYRRR